MKLIPILFSTLMVQAEKEGRKSMTRRTRGLELINENPSQWQFLGLQVFADGNLYAKFQNDSIVQNIKCSFGQSGDVLWVREGFSLPILMDGCEPDYLYKADGDIQRWGGRPWKPGIHMPYIACRTWLLNKSVRLERLYSISTEDILNEGVRYGVFAKGVMASPVFRIGIDDSALSFMPENWQQLPPKELDAALLFAHWAELWCEINGRESWNANPWIWRVEFERTEKPVKL